jgi:hypothetical protein
MKTFYSISDMDTNLNSFKHKFEVEFIMKDYIDFNTLLETKSKNELEKNLLSS